MNIGTVEAARLESNERWTMIKIFLISLLVILSFESNASDKKTIKMNGYLLKVQFSYKYKNRKFQTENELIVNENNQDWIPLSQGKSGVALIGKFSKEKSNAIRVEYMIIDTSAAPVSINKMGVVAVLGEKADLVSETISQMISVSLLAISKPYTEESGLDQKDSL